MIIPIGDDNTDRRLIPWLTYLLIAVNVVVFVFFKSMGNDIEFTYAFSTVMILVRGKADRLRI
jgi:hypothetical protein